MHARVFMRQKNNLQELISRRTLPAPSKLVALIGRMPTCMLRLAHHALLVNLLLRDQSVMMREAQQPDKDCGHPSLEIYLSTD